MADQREIVLRQGDATAKDIVLRDLPAASAVAGTTIYLFEGNASVNDVVLRNPAEAPSAGGSDSLTADGISAGVPGVGSPTLTQVHALSAVGVSAAAPSIGSPALGQVHALVALGVSSGVPSVGGPALAQNHALTAIGLTAGVPSVGAPVLVATVQTDADGVTHVRRKRRRDEDEWPEPDRSLRLAIEAAFVEFVEAPNPPPKPEIIRAVQQVVEADGFEASLARIEALWALYEKLRAEEAARIEDDNAAMVFLLAA